MIDMFRDNPTYEHNAKAAARAMAYENRSDPFCEARLVLYFRQGLELPSDIMADAKRLAKAREARLLGTVEARASALAAFADLEEVSHVAE